LTGCVAGRYTTSADAAKEARNGAAQDVERAVWTSLTKTPTRQGPQGARQAKTQAPPPPQAQPPQAPQTQASQAPPHHPQAPRLRQTRWPSRQSARSLQHAAPGPERSHDAGQYAPPALARGLWTTAGLPIRCVSLNAVGGYDTHSDELQTLKTNLGQTVESIVAFQRDLEARRLADRVLIQLWSEFGRRPAENGSGTDHGAAGLSFIIGTRAAGKMVGGFPGLSRLDENENLVNTSDFRAVYGGLLEQWFEVDAGLVIPEPGPLTQLPTLVQ
jgi:hypothetical protein